MIDASQTTLSEVRCPVCATPVQVAEAATCPRCGTLHHHDCWAWVGDCAIFGCQATPSRPRSAFADDATSLTALTHCAHSFARLQAAALLLTAAFCIALTITAVSMLACLLVDALNSNMTTAWSDDARSVFLAACSVSFVTAVLYLPVALLARRRGIVLTSAQPPNGRPATRAALDRLQFSTWHASLLRGLRWSFRLPAVGSSLAFVAYSICYTLFEQPIGPESFVFLFLLFLVAALMLLPMQLDECEDGIARVVEFQNRLMASFKKR